MFILFPCLLIAQIGGDHVYEFVNIPISPRAAALGGSALAIDDGDISLANENPALFSKATDGKLGMDFINYLADINLGYTSYAHHFDQVGTIGVGFQFLSGGTYTRADEDGYTYGTFSTSEYALNLSYAKSFDSLFSIGATVKPVYSQLDTYRSLGLLMDIGAIYSSKDKLTSVALLFRNMGSQLTTYNGEQEPVPFEIQLGVATKLEHAPFRFSMVLHNLETPDLSYTQSNYPEPVNTDITYTREKVLSIAQKAFMHTIFGVEFVPTKSFFVRAGYNYQRRQELKLDDKPGMTGFSWGFGFRISKFHLSYANVRYHNAGISNQFAITTNLSDFFKN